MNNRVENNRERADRATVEGLLMARVAEDPNQPLYTFLDTEGAEVTSMTTGDLALRAAQVAEVLRAKTSRQGPVLVCTRGDADQPIALFGCLMAGMTAVPVYPPTSANGDAAAETIARIATASGAEFLLAPASVGEDLAPRLGARLGDRAPEVVALPGRRDGADLPRVLTRAPDTATGRPALILYTSGSTGDPKGVEITHEALLANMSAMVASCPTGGTSRICTWLPHAHIAGLYTRLLALMGNNQAVIMPAQSFASRPTLWLAAMARYQCTFSAAPNFAYGLVASVLSDLEVGALDLSHWRMAVSGGERVRASTMDAFFTRLEPTGLRADALHPYYGMTETLCTSIPQAHAALRVNVSKAGIDRGRFRLAESTRDTVEIIGNGPPLGEGTQVLIVHPETRLPCRPGRIGELWTKGPAVTPGYYREPALSKEMVAARLADGRGPFLRTGDMAAMHEGQVFIVGRLKELLIVRGKNHYPADIEATVRVAADLPEQRCAAFTVLADEMEALGVALEIADLTAVDVAALLRSVRRAVAKCHGLAIAQLYFVPLETLPRTTSNKLARQRCRELAEMGRWKDHAATVTRQEREHEKDVSRLSGLEGLRGVALRAALLTHIVAVLAEGEVGRLAHEQLSRPLADLGMSSLEIARVASRLRAISGVEPPFAALFDGSSARELAGLMTAQIDGERRGAGGVTAWREVARKVAHAMPNEMPARRSHGGCILLTGATGYLGSYLLAAMLMQGEQPVRCIVRAEDEDAAYRRLVDALRAGPGWRDEWRGRVRALPGDVTKPRLGLGDTQWRQQLQDVATIVHNAANVNFVAPYVTLAPVNVDPVEALCELAVSGADLKTMHFVSTLAVFNATQRREQRVVRGIDRLLKPDFLYSGYAQTKWVAEASFRAAGSRGMPLAIHRPGVITGHSQTGHTNVDDFLCRLIKGCIELGYYPDSAVELDLVAVDDVADGIAASVLRPVRCIDTFHWSSPKGVLISRMMELLCSRGHHMQPEPLHQWLARIAADLPLDNALFPVHPFLLEVPSDSDETILEHFDGLPLNVETKEADELRAEANIEQRPVDEAVINRIAARLEGDGFLARADTRRMRR